MADEKMVKISQEEYDKAMAILQKQKEQREKEKLRAQDPAVKAKAAEQSKRYTAKNTLMIRKAVAAGIIVTDAEIDAELAKKK